MHYNTHLLIHHGFLQDLQMFVNLLVVILVIILFFVFWDSLRMLSYIFLSRLRSSCYYDCRVLLAIAKLSANFICLFLDLADES